MDYSTGIDYLKSKFADERNTIKEHLARGAVSDIGEYKKLCGIIRGLDVAEQIVDDLAKTVTEGDVDG